MNKIKILFLIILSLKLLSCSNVKKGLGLEKDTPNEFLAIKRDSIVLPPNYDLLTPDSVAPKEKKNNENDLSVIINNEINKENKTKLDNNIIIKSNQKRNIENDVLNQIK